MMSKSKPKVALYWCSSCGGCGEAVVDLAEGILDVVDAVDIVFWPIAMDFKYKDVESMEDGSIAVSFINGAIRTEEQEHIAKLLRRKSGLVVAFGICACTGGIPSLANLTNKARIFDLHFHASPTVINAAAVEPSTKVTVDGHELTLPGFYETVYKLNDVVKVDYYLPGCPPPPDLITGAIETILEGNLPPAGSVLAPGKSLCDSCKHNETKPDSLFMEEIKRYIDMEVDPEKCFLAQDLVCMGPATRDGCGTACINANMPCTGCFGPTDSCKEQGAKMIATLGGVLRGEDEKSAAAAMTGLIDPAGTFYRYTMSASLLGSSRKEEE